MLLLRTLALACCVGRVALAQDSLHLSGPHVFRLPSFTALRRSWSILWLSARA